MTASKLSSESDGTGVVGIVGLDALNLRRLDALVGRDEITIVDLLDRGEADGRWPAPVRICLERALRRARLARPDGIACWWDFPLSLITAVLRDRLDLAGPGLETTLRCEHKYYSRLLQAEVLPDTPNFAAVDPFSHPSMPLRSPFWIKPIKGVDSRLAYRVTSEETWQRALALIRDGIDAFGDRFDPFLDLADLPAQVASVRGRWCIAEEEIGGHQVTVEGWADDEDVHVRGVVDSHCYPGSTSFRHYEYPSVLPESIKDRLTESSRKVMRHLGYASAPFNIEYYWDPESDRIALLEINPRISQSHGHMFRLVEGAPHHQVALDLALGRAPRVDRRRGGTHAVAGKFFLRHFEQGGIVRRVPSDVDVAELRARFPEAEVELELEVGERLSEREERDARSVELGRIHLGADSHDELMERFAECEELLRWEIEPEAQGTHTSPGSEGRASEATAAP